MHWMTNRAGGGIDPGIDDPGLDLYPGTNSTRDQILRVEKCVKVKSLGLFHCLTDEETYLRMRRKCLYVCLPETILSLSCCSGEQICKPCSGGMTVGSLSHSIVTLREAANSGRYAYIYLGWSVDSLS